METIYVKRNGYLAHHDVEGQKWGVRRWQNADGSLTPEGRIHYGISVIENDTRDISSMSDRRKRQAYKQDVKDYEKISMDTMKNEYNTDKRSKKFWTEKERSELNNTYTKSAIQIRSEAEAALSKKYGEEFISKEMKRDNIKIAIVGGISLAASIGGIYVASLINEKAMLGKQQV